MCSTSKSNCLCGNVLQEHTKVLTIPCDILFTEIWTNTGDQVLRKKTRLCGCSKDAINRDSLNDLSKTYR